MSSQKSLLNKSNVGTSKLRLSLVSLGIAQGLSAPPVNAATITVNNRLDADTNCTLRDAITSINNAGEELGCVNTGPNFGVNDIVLFTETSIQLNNRVLPITQSMTIDGGAGTTIASDGNTGIFSIDGSLGSPVSVNLRNLTLTGGEANSGGAIYAKQTQLSLFETTLSNNRADYGGGLFVSDNSSVSITNSTISANTASKDGGGIWISDFSDITITNTQISTNSATDEGGGVYISYYSDIDLIDTTMLDNRSYQGGGVFAYVITNTRLDKSTISGSDSGRGGGFFGNHYSNLILVNNSTISDNTASSHGGGVYVNTYSEVSLDGSTISNNLAFSNGGGIFAKDQDTGPSFVVELLNSTLNNNTSYLTGGGIYLSSNRLVISQSTISNNIAFDRVGGIYAESSTVKLSNCTISGNYAGNSLGGISLVSSDADILSCTIARNNGLYFGGGISGLLSSISLKNSIVANSFGLADCLAADSTVNADNSNIIEDGSCSTGAMAVDPLLGPLRDNGGPTFTHALLADSPAINAGNSADCSAAPINNRDQRGSSRAGGSSCDIGAFEVDDNLFFVIPLANGKSVIFSL